MTNEEVVRALWARMSELRFDDIADLLDPGIVCD